MFDFDLELQNLPDRPGVYIMKDKDNEIIYVGKAKVLKNRVRQYFHESANHPPKVRMMVQKICSFEYITTDTELEALILECNLIKKHKPKYNIRLKDDKNYPLIKITVNEEFPRVFVVRKISNDGARYFGPYSSSLAVRDTLNLIKKLFAIRTCSLVLPRDIGKTRPCLNYHIQQCVAPCSGKVSKEEYGALIEQIIHFLEGKYGPLLKDLQAQMAEAANNMQYEKAANIRDKINGIQKVAEKQKIIHGLKNDKDIIAFARNDKNACFELFSVREGKLIGRDHFVFEGIQEETDQSVLSNFIKQYYNSAPAVPKELLVECEIEEREVIETWLSDKRGSKVTVRIPLKGNNEKLLSMAKSNAQQFLEQLVLRTKADNAVLLDLKKTLALDKLPKRIESYDISNTSGADCVGSMVVFKDAKPLKRAFRKFNIENNGQPNDYESMREVIYRRLRRAEKERMLIEDGELLLSNAKFLPLPDLILLDGGRGHVGVIKQLLNQLNISIPVFGMVKDDKHRTRSLTSETQEVAISFNSPLYRLLYQMQEEVHNQAIRHHHKKHEKNSFDSVLSDIAGVGDKTKQILLKSFPSLQAIKDASLLELLHTQGINEKTAHNIYDYFHR